MSNHPVDLLLRRSFGGIGVITRERMRIWVKGPVPTLLDAEHLMALWDEGNRRANLPGQREGDKHVQPFEDMMQGFRQLGYVGAGDDGVSAPDWYVCLTVDTYDADIRERLLKAEGATK